MIKLALSLVALALASPAFAAPSYCLLKVEEQNKVLASYSVARQENNVLTTHSSSLAAPPQASSCI